MVQDVDFPLAPVYDRIVEQLYDYDAIAEVIARELGPTSSLLELCVGTGGLALAVMRRGPTVTGLDGSRAMLDQAERAGAAALAELGGRELRLVSDGAMRFSLGGVFDGIYVHSGHVLLNAGEDGLLVNGLGEDELRTALGTAATHLRAGGRLMLSIERWEPEGAWTRSCELGPEAGFWPARPEGSWYRRFIVEENERFGTRMHVFFDSTDGSLYVERSRRRPKLSEAVLVRVLHEVGFADVCVVPVDSRATPGFLVATRPAGRPATRQAGPAVSSAGDPPGTSRTARTGGRPGPGSHAGT